MGCDASVLEVSCTEDQLPLHPVFLDDFAIDIYEVTNQQLAGSP